MEQQDKQGWRETLQYTVDNAEDGEWYIGGLVNYPSVHSYGRSLNDLVGSIKALASLEKDRLSDIEKEEYQLRLQEMTAEEYECRQDNTDYWVIEDMKRYLKRPTIQEKWKKIIVKVLADEVGIWKTSSMDAVNKVMSAIINMENE